MRSSPRSATSPASIASRRSHFGLGLYGAGFPLGSGLALIAMPALAAWTGGWRGAFAIESAAIAVVLLLWLPAPNVAAAPASGTMRDALRCRNCWWTSLQHAAGFGLGLSAGTWITVYLLREFSLPLTLSGLIGSGLLLMAVTGRAIGGWLGASEHVASKPTMRAAAVAVRAGAVLLALPGRPLSLALAGATVGAPVMGLALQTFGFAAAWAYLAVVAGAAFAVTFVMRGEEDLA